MISGRGSALSRLWDAAPETPRTAVRSYSAAPCARVESSCFGTACTRREATKCDSYSGAYTRQNVMCMENQINEGVVNVLVLLKIVELLLSGARW